MKNQSDTSPFEAWENLIAEIIGKDLLLQQTIPRSPVGMSGLVCTSIEKPERIDVLITTRCSMACSHCAVNAGPGGYDMSMETFRAVCEKIRNLPRTVVKRRITISGGEPTLHPHFWQFIELIQKALNVSGHTLGVFTNGSRKEDALRLAEMAQERHFTARLSYYNLNDKSIIHPDVVEAFRASSPYLKIRPFAGKPSPVGRAASWPPEKTMPYCWANYWIVDPDGTIYHCGCRQEKAGTVFDRRNILAGRSSPCKRFPDFETVLARETEKMRKELNIDNLPPAQAVLALRFVREAIKQRWSGEVITDDDFSIIPKLFNEALSRGGQHDR